MAKKKPVAKVVDSGNGDGKEKESVSLKPILKKKIRMRIVGVSPLIQHQWGKKAVDAMRQKHAGKKTKTREVRDPEQEGREAMYVTQNGEPGVPALAIKKACISAAHKDIGIEKTLVRKALFILTDDPNKIIPMECSEPVIKEDPVRVGQGSTDLRYRPYFYEWAVIITWEIDAELLQVGDLINLVDRAGFGVGLNEWRPEYGGEYGRFKVDQTYPIEEVD